MMRLIACFIICILPLTIQARDGVGDAIEQIITKTDPSLNIGIKITNLDKNKVVFAKNAARYFIPASTLKFIASVAFLEHFGKDYQFTSRVLKKGSSYYLDIHDPDFKTEDLAHLVKELAEYSGKKIKGNIYILNREFSVPPAMGDKTCSDITYCMGAPVTLVHINKNCSRLPVSAKRVGKKISVKPDEDFPYHIKNNTKTIPKGERDRLRVDVKNGQYIISGTLCMGRGKVEIGGVVSDNNLSNVKYHLKKQLAKAGIQLKGKILYKKTLPKGRLVSSVSKSLQDIVAIALKQSDNFIMDYLLAELATQNNQHEWRLAVSSLKKLVHEKLGVNLQNSVIKDVSGLSRSNLIAINQFDSLLKQIAKQPNFAEIKGFMAIPGEDGTLQERFNGMKKLYAKTGTLGNVSNIIGYFYDKNNELHSFAIFSNNFYGRRAKYRMLQEDIIRLVAGDNSFLE